MTGSINVIRHQLPKSIYVESIRYEDTPDTTIEIKLGNKGVAPYNNIRIKYELSPNEEFISGGGPTPSQFRNRAVVFRALSSISPYALAIYKVRTKGEPKGQVLALGEAYENNESDGLLRYLRIASFALSYGTRERVFEPCFQEIKMDRVESKQYRENRRERVLGKFCFVFRAALLFLGCLRMELSNGVCKLALGVILFIKKRWHDDE